MLLPLDQSWTDAVWRSPYRLRFKLSTGGSFINMFTSSYDRARELARAALSTDRPLAVIAAYRGATWDIQVDDSELGMTSFAALAEMGVSTDVIEASWDGYFHPGEDRDDEITPYEHRALGVTWDEADILLWNNIAQEIGVRPRAPLFSKLVDRGRGIVVNAYDDRGMDITALSPDPIEHLYRRYDAWLLDYDRPRMAEAFGPGASK